jgi:hypothetical protein
VVLTSSRYAIASVQTFAGVAVDSSGALEYVERHVVKYENGKIIESQTTYFDQDQKKIGQIISDYTHGPQLGSYQFTDMRARYADGVTVTPDRIEMFRRKSPASPVESKTLSREFNQVVGQGFHRFIVNNLKNIANGKVFQVKLIMPSRLNQYDFRIRKDKIQGDVLSVRIEIDNWLLRLFAPHLDVDYDLKTGRLLRYEGMSNLTSVEGKHEKVIISYRYD